MLNIVRQGAVAIRQEVRGGLFKHRCNLGEPTKKKLVQFPIFVLIKKKNVRYELRFM